jgi:hypothetical protein
MDVQFQLAESRRPLEGLGVGTMAILNRKVLEEAIACIHLTVLCVHDKQVERKLHKLHVMK